jgi:hypothetical protein
MRKEPRTKNQDPEKLQSSNLKRTTPAKFYPQQGAGAAPLLIWCLVFGVSLELGACSLELFPTCNFQPSTFTA